MCTAVHLAATGRQHRLTKAYLYNSDQNDHSVIIQAVVKHLIHGNNNNNNNNNNTKKSGCIDIFERPWRNVLLEPI